MSFLPDIVHGTYDLQFELLRLEISYRLRAGDMMLLEPLKRAVSTFRRILVRSYTPSICPALYPLTSPAKYPFEAIWLAINLALSSFEFAIVEMDTNKSQ